MKRRAGDDDGLTLIELLITMAVMLVIIVPISGSFILGLVTAHGSFQDTTNSADAQLLAGLFDTDVTNAETVAASGTCGGASTAVELAWRDGAALVTVAYRAVTDPAMQAELATSTAIDRLERVRCVNGDPVDTTVVARSLLSAGGVSVTCDGGTCGASSPRRVQIQLKGFAPQLGDSGTSGTYTFGITATRKVTA